jgi:excisionase family DNA binding protein
MSSIAEPKPYLTQDEVARRLEVTGQTVRRWRAEGRLPKPIQIGRKLLFRAGDIDAHLARLHAKVS